MFKHTLSLVIIIKNAEKLLENTLLSCNDLVDEIIAVDDYSTDSTIDILKKYNAKIYSHHEMDLGLQRKYALKKAYGKWILILDSDEMLTSEVKKEISEIIKKDLNSIDGYWVPFQTHFLGKPLYHGGETYKKMVFFKKDKVKIKANLVHEKYEVEEKRAGVLKNKILHFSYENIFFMYKKFHDYALRAGKQKLKDGEKSTLKKIIMYPIHMFYARFVHDKGYKDGLIRIPLDFGFAYMEFVSYLYIYFNQK
ncbi:MAG: glycosyltransferase family 2 protein [bacterium]|nr:glycosyltransferase family 2 protein [bacterium]